MGGLDQLARQTLRLDSPNVYTTLQFQISCFRFSSLFCVGAGQMCLAGKHCGKGGQMFIKVDLLIHFCSYCLHPMIHTPVYSTLFYVEILSHHVILRKGWEVYINGVNH